MSITTLAILTVSICFSIVTHTIGYFINRRPKFIVVGAMSYREFGSWHKAKAFIDKELGEHQVFIYEKNEYTYITSSNYTRRLFTKQSEIDLTEQENLHDYSESG